MGLRWGLTPSIPLSSEMTLKELTLLSLHEGKTVHGYPTWLQVVDPFDHLLAVTAVSGNGRQGQVDQSATIIHSRCHATPQLWIQWAASQGNDRSPLQLQSLGPPETKDHKILSSSGHSLAYFLESWLCWDCWSCWAHVTDAYGSGYILF